MTQFFFEYGLFAAKLFTFVIAILAIVIVSVGVTRRVKKSMKGHIETTKVNDEIEAMRFALDAAISDPEAYKLHVKQWHKEKKLEHKARKKALKQAARGDAPGAAEADAKPRVYVLDFRGDLRALAVSKLRQEITAVLSMAQTSDEVVVRLESAGGMVHAYGLASSQLQRVKDHGIGLTVCVDKVAASGGYMMACVADRIVAAPFAVLGSIGVLAQLPNFHRLLKKNDIDFELFTAGEYKRTVTMFGENTDKGREKFSEELEETHDLFKNFVSVNRPALDIAKVATGEVWYGQQALDEGLIDELATSDAFVQERLKDWDVYEVKFVHKKNWQEKLGLATEGALEKSFLKIWQRSQGRNTY